MKKKPSTERQKIWDRIKSQVEAYSTKELETYKHFGKKKKHPLKLELERLQRMRERHEITLYSALVRFRAVIDQSFGRNVSDQELLEFIKELQK